MLTDKIAIVTGASSGIGRAAALLFARRGAMVVATARRQIELDALVDEASAFGGDIVAHAGDIREESTARRLVEIARTRFGGLDIAFNNAGVLGETGAVTGLSLAGWNDVIATNLTSAFLGAKHQLPAMLERGGGSIIFSSTFVGPSVGMPGLGGYAAAKSGIAGLVRTIAAEYGAAGIRANALAPGATDTPASVTNGPDATPELVGFVTGLHALKRIAQPDEIAEVALFLASDASSFVTGSLLMADGGVSIVRS